MQKEREKRESKDSEKGERLDSTHSLDTLVRFDTLVGHKTRTLGTWDMSHTHCTCDRHIAHETDTFDMRHVT